MVTFPISRTNTTCALFERRKNLNKLFQLTRDNYPITACLTLSQYGIPQATANQINCFINATLSMNYGYLHVADRDASSVWIMVEEYMPFKSHDAVDILVVL